MQNPRERADSDDFVSSRETRRRALAERIGPEACVLNFSFGTPRMRNVIVRDLPNAQYRLIYLAIFAVLRGGLGNGVIARV